MQDRKNDNQDAGTQKDALFIEEFDFPEEAEAEEEAKEALPKLDEEEALTDNGEEAPLPTDNKEEEALLPTDNGEEEVSLPTDNKKEEALLPTDNEDEEAPLSMEELRALFEELKSAPEPLRSSKRKEGNRHGIKKKTMRHVEEGALGSEEAEALEAGEAFSSEQTKVRKDIDRKGVLGRGLAACLLLLVIAVPAAFFVRGMGDGSRQKKGFRAGEASESETTVPETTLSEEELAELAYQETVDQELLNYENLGIIDASGYINLRSQPDSVDMTNIIGKLPSMSACSIVSTEGEWSLIQSGGIQGYAYNEYIKTGEEARTLAKDAMKDRAVILADRLNIRSAPEVNAENVVGKARKGERYEVLSVEGDWAKITADFSDTVDEAFINIADGNAELKLCLNEARKFDLRELALTQFDNLVVSAADGFINIRETPENDGINNICGKFPSSAGAELLETVEGDGRTWHKIKSGDVTGYVSAEYCATGEAAKEAALNGAVLTAFVRTDALNVRSEPSTEARAWTQVTKNQAYEVIDQLDGWVEIELEGADNESGEGDRAFISTRDNNVEVKYGLPEAVEYYPAVEAANAAAAFRNEIVNYACQFVGNPYVWGGTSLTKGADCSGFTMKVLEHFGIKIPRVSRDQAKAGVRVTSDQMKPGDLVFYANSSGTINHVGMYIGNGQIVNAASRKSGIRIYRWNYRTPVAIRNVIGP